MDLSQLSDADLEAISKNDLKSVSDHGLDVLHAQSAPPPEPVSNTEAALRGAGQGATLGFEDELAGAAHAPLGAIKKIGGYLGVEPSKTDEDIANYEMARNKEREANQRAETDHPYVYGGSQFAGAAIPTVLSGGLGAEATLGEMALSGARFGAASGLGGSNADTSKGLVEDTGMGAGVGGVIGAAVPLAGKYVVKPVAGAIAESPVGQMPAKVTQYLAKKFGKVYANVPEEMTQEYIDRGGNISARPADQIMDDLSSRYEKAQSGLDSAKIANESAKDAAGEAKFNAQNEFVDQRFQAKNAADEAKAELDQSFAAKKEALQNSNVQHLKEPITKSIDELKSQVIKGSQDAMEVLGKQQGAVQIAPILQTLDEQIKGMTINDTPVSKTAVNSINELQGLRQRLSGLGEEISFKQAKAAIKQLDDDITYSSKNGEFTPQVDRATQAVRKAFDTVLKEQSPEYAEAMKPVAQKAQLLEELTKNFGTDQQVIGKLNNIHSEVGQQVHLPQLQALGEQTGQDFVTPIQAHSANMETLSTPSKMQEIQQSLPEFQKHQQASAHYDSLMNPAARRQVAEAPGVTRANDLLAKRQVELEAAQDQANVMRPLNPQTVQSRMKALTGARNYGAENTFSDIDQATGQNFSGEIKDRALLDQFRKADTQGSRKVAAGAAAGFAVGGAPGAAVGAALGGVADRYAGQTFKAALDTGIGIEKFARQLGPYANVLQKAATRGPQAVAATHYLLQQTDEKYRKRLDVIQHEESH